MYKKKFIIKDLTTLTFWRGVKKDNEGYVIDQDKFDLFTPRVGNAKKFDTIKEAEKEIEIYSVTTGGCKMSHTALGIIKVYFTNEK